ncbi:MAG: Ada metal-binding domain-containing protein, partial [Pseudomonadota bacterium]
MNRNTSISQTAETAERVEAVMARDAAYDGRFFYGVLTTGVYCRPSCKSRRPRPENLRFFLATADAEAAGFRACKRCRPEQLAQETEQLVSLARYIHDHADEKLPLRHLADISGLSSSRLQKSFKKALGVSPKQFQDAARLGALKDALKQGDQITGAIFSAGFGSTSRVYGEASRNLGMTPAAYRSGGAGEQINFACRETALGPLLMAATDRGVCFAQFGDSETALLKQLREEFPAAILQPAPD